MQEEEVYVQVYGQIYGLTYQGFRGTYDCREFKAKSVEEAKAIIDQGFEKKGLDGFGFDSYLAGMFTLEINRKRIIDGDMWTNIKYEVYEKGSEKNLKYMRKALSEQWGIKHAK